jgi:hypothetical protein
MEEWIDSPLFLVSGQLHASAALPRVKNSRCILDRRLGGPQNQSGRREEEKTLDHIGARTPNPRPSIPWPVAIPIALSPYSYVNTRD